MKVLFSIALILIISSAVTFADQSIVNNDGTNRLQPIAPHVYGGVDALDGEFPHICSVQWVFVGRSQHICGASIINELWLLTSSFCISSSSNLGRLDVICGQLNLADTSPAQSQRVTVLTSFMHPNYTLGHVNDIALLRLERQLFYTDNVQPILLPPQLGIPIGIATLIGWGGSDDGLLLQSLGSLKMNRVAILPPGMCEQFAIVPPSTFCSGPITGGLSACEIDTGTSLTQHFGGSATIVGIVTLTPCGAPGVPGIYTSVGPFVSWIQGVMGV